MSKHKQSEVVEDDEASSISVGFESFISDLSRITQKIKESYLPHKDNKSQNSMAQILNDGLDNLKSDLPDFASKLWKERRRREKIFDNQILGEPGWDILLFLFSKRGSGRNMYVKDVCYSAGVPDTTALRWIDVLARENLVTKSLDAQDKRKQKIEITPEGISKMTDFLNGILGV